MKWDLSGIIEARDVVSRRVLPSRTHKRGAAFRESLDLELGKVAYGAKGRRHYTVKARNIGGRR
jgi:hypothetical protein